MNKIYVVLMMFLVSIAFWAQSPKREMRATWFQTVYGGSSTSGADWPLSKIYATGNTSQIARQKEQMIDKLDALKAANMNAICFQARSRSDAMYKSSYEPWSSDLVSSRGLDPGYDPLEFVVEECHKRGIECHVWINPYRYESNAEIGNWGDDDVYRRDHLDWILTVPQQRDDGSWYDATILDPGNPDVRKRIVDVIKEIVTNYDIDGVLFDDYFYLKGIVNQDSVSQRSKPAGQSLEDWRRENVNKMVADVYKMIQGIKPYVRFGIGPSGIWGGDAESQIKYGVTNPAGIGGGYAFKGISCDPLAWLSEGSIDYVSPQIYWKSKENGGAADSDYRTLVHWWSDVAHKFHRHMYVSQNSSRMVSNKWPYESEVKGETLINRQYAHNDAPGGLYFTTSAYLKYGERKDQTIAEFLKDNVYTQPALLPAINWKEYVEKSSPTNIRIENNTLRWDCADDCRRYSVYAIPNEQAKWAGNFATSKYLLGMSYGKSYDLGQIESLMNTHKFGVAPMDDYGNEFAPGLMDYVSNSNKEAELLTPANGGRAVSPAYFSWKRVGGAEYYVFELSQTADFAEILYRRDVADVYFSNTDVPVEDGKIYYWRIRTRTIGLKDCISTPRSFTQNTIAITSLSNNETSVSLTPNIAWTEVGAGYTYTLQLSVNSDFSESNEFNNIGSNSFELPLGSIAAFSTYYIRVKGVKNSLETAWSPTVKFSTVETVADIPQILSPLNGGNLSGSMLIKWSEEPYANQFTVQVSPTEAFPWAGRKSQIVSAFTYEFDFGNEDFVVGDTYYTRAKAKSGTTETDWSPVVSFVYVGGTGIDYTSNDAYKLICPTLLNSDYVNVTYVLPSMQNIRLYLCDMTGKLVINLHNGEADAGTNEVLIETYSLTKGLYLLVMETEDGKKILKLVK